MAKETRQRKPGKWDRNQVAQKSRAEKRMQSFNET